MIVPALIEKFITDPKDIGAVPGVLASKRGRFCVSPKRWQGMQPLGQHSVVWMNSIVAELVETVSSREMEDLITGYTLLDGGPKSESDMRNQQDYDAGSQLEGPKTRHY